MNENELIVFLQIFESITCLKDLSETRRYLLSSLSQWVGSDLSVLLQVKQGEKSAETLCVHARSEQLRTAFQSRFEQYFVSDPLHLKILAAPQAAFTLEEYLGDAAWRSSTLYGNVFHHAGANDAAVLLLRDKEGRVRWVACFALGRSTVPLKDNLKFLNNAAPHLFAGLENLTHCDERLKHTQAVESLLNYTQDMLVCVSLPNKGEARVVAATRPAQRTLGLNAIETMPSERIQEFLDLALSESSVQNAPRWLSPDGQLYRVSREATPKTQNGSLVLIRMEPAGVNEPQREDELRAAEAAGLSSRESAVFMQLARGLANRDIAKSMGISIDTVRAHLRNIFTKLKVSSRVEAVNAVRRRMETSVTLQKPSNSPIDRPKALNNDTARSVK